MRAYYCEANSDLTVPDTRQVPADSLAALGVKLWSCDVSDYEAELRKVAKENGFPADAALETFDATLYTGQPVSPLLQESIKLLMSQGSLSAVSETTMLFPKTLWHVYSRVNVFLTLKVSAPDIKRQRSNHTASN
ncbi:hypothetical protein VNI00_007711 [Paramarasmius palmivorus]|uniref:Uncharacterized protein n=1 Tax=Paramarasmius palmivorus TaxID=297713 RepID=A0AAW0CZU6_9AGAR